ncbi:hypothetical protein TSAR_014115 [Trichomalopsis sarcophagae]|uniref:Tudor domain-containing protein 3 n=1 Tax=Trichomalopsis sarcophagae TaxID=543379 RepID=A0A232EUC1_9HYME|nr:hypothetical protein TSAR_014115 [Trichomalopsis sarcophagae]
MTIGIMEKLRDCGWYLSEQGFDVVSDYGSIVDVQKIIKRATDHDLKEISSGEGELTSGDIVLQIQKVRNIAAPKHNEESRGAPRMLKLSLTDGKTSYQAIEIENISSISLNTPPGTKLLIRGGTLPMSHGVILLKPFNIVQVLGGKVTSLVEKWELNKKLASHSRVRPVEEGGPPPWIPFGKKIVKITEQGKNFKALAEKEKTTEENAEFEAQRKNAIAEAAKQGSKKVFGGGNKQLLDHTVQRIVDQGFSIEQAEYALKVNRNNVDRALKSLQKNDNRNNSNTREAREPREPKGKRGDKKSGEEVSSKPSSGKISLFDFLEDKLPAQTEIPETNNVNVSDSYAKNRPDNHSDRYHSRGNEHSQLGRGGGGRNQRVNRGYQVPPRHLEENRSNKYSNNTASNQQYGNYGGMNSQKTKPPRFQRNQENQNFNQNMNQNYSSYQPQEPIGTYNKFPQVNEFRNSMPSAFSQPRQDSATPRDNSANAFKPNHQDFQIKNQQEYQTKVVSNSRGQNYESNLRQGRVQEADPRLYQSNTVDRGYKGSQSNRFYDDIPDYQGIASSNTQKSNSFYNSHSKSDDSLGGTWVWRVGDRCMAKYWEDNMYYNAEVTAVSKTTCVVQFKEFHNYEEVLQIDCIPITEDDPPTQTLGQESNRRSDHRSSNRPPRFEQNQNNSNASEYRRGGGSGGSGKNYRKRGQQRSAQPIYQPPAQRGGATFLPQNT